jgi:hypothetical protein
MNYKIQVIWLDKLAEIICKNKKVHGFLFRKQERV